MRRYDYTHDFGFGSVYAFDIADAITKIRALYRNTVLGRLNVTLASKAK